MPVSCHLRRWILEITASHEAVNRRVVGSNPIVPTISFLGLICPLVCPPDLAFTYLIGNLMRNTFDLCDILGVEG